MNRAEVLRAVGALYDRMIRQGQSATAILVGVVDSDSELTVGVDGGAEVEITMIGVGAQRTRTAEVIAGRDVIDASEVVEIGGVARER